MAESRRLNTAVHCPNCDFLVKPWVIRTKSKDIGRGDEPFLLVQCPMKACGHQFDIFAVADEPLPAPPPPDA
jgi:hypothetical protein